MAETSEMDSLAEEVLRRNQMRKQSTAVAEQEQTQDYSENENTVDYGNEQKEKRQARPAEPKSRCDGELVTFRFRRLPFRFKKVPEFRRICNEDGQVVTQNSEWFSINPADMSAFKFHICVGMTSTRNRKLVEKLNKRINLHDMHFIDPFHVSAVASSLFHSYLQETAGLVATKLTCFVPAEDFEIKGGECD